MRTLPRVSSPWRKIKAVLLAAVMCTVFYVLWQFFVPKLGATATTFTVREGQSVKQIGAGLKHAGLLRSQFWFETWVWLTRTETSFGAGEYELRRASVASIVRLLTSSVPPASEVTLRFIEGWTIRDMTRYLAAANWGAAGTFAGDVSTANVVQEALLDISPELIQGKPARASLEGYLFPDTYRLYHDAKNSDLIGKMLKNFERKFLPEWRAEVKQRGYTVYQAVIMASVVEREVRSDPDRAMVADIFWRRVEAGMGLEADSTVNYVTGKSLPAVTLEDTKVDSPYNTYRYRGLPPGPISNPGAAALRAAVYPKPNEFWYFLTTPKGEVIYSRTFEEHKAAKAKHLR